MAQKVDRRSEYESVKREIKTIDPGTYLFLSRINRVTFLEGSLTATISATRTMTVDVWNSPMAGKEFDLIFGIDFWDSLNFTEKVFLCMHEIYHGILDHFNRFPSVDVITNAATDLAVNATLLRQFSFDVADLPTLRKMGVWTDTILKEPLDDRYSAEHYKFILEREKPKLPKGFDQHKGSAVGTLVQAVVKNIRHDTTNEAERKVLNLVRAATPRSLEHLTDTIETSRSSSQWKALAAKLQKSALEEIEESWMPNRRLQVAFQCTDTTIPSDSILDDIQKPEVDVYLDTSYSCEKYIPMFQGCLKALQKYFVVHKYGFSNEVYPYTGEVRIGGTNFVAVQSNVEKSKSRYVLVFSDCVFHANSSQDKRLIFLTFEEHREHWLERRKYLPNSIHKTIEGFR